MIRDPSENAWQMYRIAVIAGMERRPFADAVGELWFAGEDCGALRHAWREWKIARRVGDPEMPWTLGRWLRIIAIPALLGDRRAVAMPRATRPTAPWRGRNGRPVTG
jgi:hypothetical protein